MTTGPPAANATHAWVSMARRPHEAVAEPPVIHPVSRVGGLPLRQQFEEQRAVNARHTEVLELQAQELKASLEQHEREAVQRQRGQDAQTLAVPENPE